MDPLAAEFSEYVQVAAYYAWQKRLAAANAQGDAITGGADSDWREGEKQIVAFEETPAVP